MKDSKLENLIALRNDLYNTRTGERLLEYLQDYITEQSCIANREPNTIKGMCEIVQQIKIIPQKVDKK